MGRVAVMAAFTLASLSACTEEAPVAQAPLAYEGGLVSLLADDLMQVTVSMGESATQADLRTYADCTAAQATLFRGLGFARHVRTTVNEEAGIRRADAVYTVSSTLPAGLRTIDAEAKVEACNEMGIPRV